MAKKQLKTRNLKPLIGAGVFIAVWTITLAVVNIAEIISNILPSGTDGSNGVRLVNTLTLAFLLVPVAVAWVIACFWTTSSGIAREKKSRFTTVVYVLLASLVTAVVIGFAVTFIFDAISLLLYFN